MLSDFFEDFLLFKEVEGLVKESMFDESKKNSDSCNDDAKSYFHAISDKYENGELVYHREKEVKDGKVLKDEGSARKIEDKKEEKCCNSQKTSTLEAENKRLNNALMKSEREIKYLQKENKELKEKLNMIKSIF